MIPTNDDGLAYLVCNADVEAISTACALWEQSVAEHLCHIFKLV